VSEYESNPIVASALAAKYDAEAEHYRQQARAHKAEADATEWNLFLHKRQDTFDHAADVHNQVYRFMQPNAKLPSGYVDENSVALCVEHLSRWSRLNPGSDMTIILNSPGGYTSFGMELFDFIEDLKTSDHEVTIHARGWAASMASVILQAASPGRRLMGAEALLLLHQGSGGVVGSVGDMEDYKEYLDMVSGRMLSIYAARCQEAGKRGTAPKALTKAQLKNRWNRKDLWIASEDALAFGLVDEVR
jgi:ATP-dependent Clp protease protease subunit